MRCALRATYYVTTPMWCSSSWRLGWCKRRLYGSVFDLQYWYPTASAPTRVPEKRMVANTTSRKRVRNRDHERINLLKAYEYTSFNSS